MLNIFICTRFLAGFFLAFLPEITTRQTAQPAMRVYAFLGTDCPISQDYIGVLNEMNIRYYSKVIFVGLIPDGVTKDDIQQFKDEYQVKFDLEPDNKMTLIKRYDIRTTPEVVLVDHSNQVRYQGAIDNWFYALGKHRPAPTERYLQDAIEQSMSGNEVKVKRTEAIGCVLNRTREHAQSKSTLHEH